jgi:mRNA interferase MazF
VGRVSEPQRGEVWLAEVPSDKRRPVLILTRDSVLPRLTTVLVAPVTTRIRTIPTEVPLGEAQGLSRPCVANLDNIMPLAKAQLVQRLGALDADQLRQTCRAARFAINC